MTGSRLADMAIAEARAALGARDPEQANEWLSAVGPSARPRDLEAAIEYELGKGAADRGAWGESERLFAEAVRLDPLPLHQHRLGLARRCGGMQDDATWATLRAKVDAARNLPDDVLTPEVTGVWSCGAYHAWGAPRSMPWSRLLRMAKGPGEDLAQHEAAVSLASGFFCRFLQDETPVLRWVDVVVAIPANPSRYAARHMSLPDRLAQAVQSQLGVPWLFDALRWTGEEDVELRGLTWWERREAVRDAMSAGDVGLAHRRNVLLVDDVITSGATMREAARLLRAAGCGDVYATSLCHTEG